MLHSALEPGPDVLGGSWFKFFILFTLACTSHTLFLKFWKKRSEAIPKVSEKTTGRVVPIIDAVQFLASRDISQDFAYEDEYGSSYVPEPFVPDTSDTETEPLEPDTYTEAEWWRKIEHAGKLAGREKWAEAADEYRKIGNECSIFIISAPAWRGAAICYDGLNDERALACYKNAVLGYQKLANQGHEDAQEELAGAEQELAEFLDRKK